MACEVQTGYSLYECKQEVEDPFSAKAIIEAKSPPSHDLADFELKKHTYSHDLESLWWLILWIITSLIGYPESYSDAYVYFGKNDKMKRMHLLTHGGLPVLEPRVEGFRWPLNKVRAVLIRGYRGRVPWADIEKLYTYKGVSVVFLDFFAKIKECPGDWESVELRDPRGRSLHAIADAADSAPGTGTTQPNSKKRKDRTRDDNSEQGAGARADGPGPSKKTRNSS